MKKRVRIGLVVFLVLCVVWAVSLVLVPQSTLFHGKPASKWIKGITYFGDDAQVKQWRAFGPEGLHLLARALDKGRLYRKAYRWFMPRLPGPINSFLYPRLPKPADSHSIRMCVISLLSQLGTDAKPVEPAIARALNDDDNGVRLSALGCYKQLLSVMSEKEKVARLPAFLLALEDRDSGIRNNAAVALWHYSGHGPQVVPALVQRLQDPNIEVRLQAAKALAHIDVQAATRAGVVPIAVQILNEPNDQVAYQAAQLLGEMGKEPDLAVPALIASVHGTNGLVASWAARSLGNFPSQANIIVPVLLKALHDTNGIISRWGPADALKAIDPAAAAKAGIK